MPYVIFDIATVVHHERKQNSSAAKMRGISTICDYDSNVYILMFTVFFMHSKWSDCGFKRLM